MESIRFDDIEKLRSKVSSEYSGWSQEVEVTQDKINQFADVTGDHQRKRSGQRQRRPST